MIRAIVLTQLILNSIEGKPSARDAIRVSPNQPTKVELIPDVVREFVETKNYIAIRSLSVGRLQRHNRAAVVCDRNFKAALVRQREQTHRPIVRDTPLFLLDHFRSSLNTRFASFNVSIEPTSNHKPGTRSEEHTSELQSHSFISYAVF